MPITWREHRKTLGPTPAEVAAWARTATLGARLHGALWRRWPRWFRRPPASYPTGARERGIVRSWLTAFPYLTTIALSDPAGETGWPEEPPGA